jgi:hypothetical protein
VSIHPAALVLADHQPVYVTASTQPGSTVRCCSCDWTGPWCEFPEHQAQVLAEAGVLACPSCGHPTGAHSAGSCTDGWGPLGVLGCLCPGDADATPATTP